VHSRCPKPTRALASTLRRKPSRGTASSKSGIGEGRWKAAGLFRCRLGERPGEQFGEGGISEVGRLPVGKAPGHRQDLGRESIIRRPIVGGDGRGIIVVGARGECRGGFVRDTEAGGLAASRPARASALRMTAPIAASACHTWRQRIAAEPRSAAVTIFRASTRSRRVSRGRGIGRLQRAQTPLELGCFDRADIGLDHMTQLHRFARRDGTLRRSVGDRGHRTR
jgi:hypothetical protein